MLYYQVHISWVCRCFKVEMGASSYCGNALHSRTYFSGDSVCIFERAVAIVLTNDEMDWHLCELLKATPNKWRDSLPIKIIWGILLESTFHSNLGVPLSCPYGLWLSRDDHSVHTSTWPEVPADFLLVFFPRWSVHDPDSKVPQCPDAILIINV